MGKGKPGKGSVTKAMGRVFLKGSNAQLWSTAFRAMVGSKRFERMKEMCCEASGRVEAREKVE